MISTRNRSRRISRLRIGDALQREQQLPGAVEHRVVVDALALVEPLQVDPERILIDEVGRKPAAVGDEVAVVLVGGDPALHAARRIDERLEAMPAHHRAHHRIAGKIGAEEVERQR